MYHLMQSFGRFQSTRLREARLIACEQTNRICYGFNPRAYVRRDLCDQQMHFHKFLFQSTRLREARRL